MQVSARRAYAQFSTGPNHPSLNFKRVDRNDPVFSVRIGIHYRALGLLDGDTVTWFWIGIHDDYARAERLSRPAAAPPASDTVTVRRKGAPP